MWASSSKWSWTRAVTGLAVAAIFVQSLLASRAVVNNRQGRDFATYHYAAVVVAEGGSPYQTSALSKAAREENTRRAVHPFFYPPPFLGLMAWDRGLSLGTAYSLWFGANWLALLGTLVTLRRWLGTPWFLLLGIAATLTPIYNSLIMGQANQLVLWPAVVGLATGRGLWVALSAMWKMSPALYLAGWAAQRQWRPILEAMVGAVLLSIVALIWVPFDTQMHFYLDILPGFSSGEYHGLRVPINLPANHSIPDLFHQLWPGPDHHHLDPRAATASKLVTMSLLIALATLGARMRDADPIAQANLAGALTVLMVITPVYAYEHHLAWLLFPGVTIAHALWSQRIDRRWVWVAGPAWLQCAAHLSWVRALREALPAGLAWCVQESKFAGLLGLLLVCAVAARARPDGATS